MHSQQNIASWSRRPRGFSLLELLAVVTIMGILAVLIIPRIGASSQDAKRKMCWQYQGDINTAIERYHFDRGIWITNLTWLEGLEYYPEEIPVCPVDNTVYVVDPATNRISGHNH